MMPAAEFDSFASSYEADLDQALSVSGENKDFFAEGRVKWLAHRLQQIGFQPTSALDYGCGIGGTAVLLRQHVHVESVVGLDVSARSIEVAQSRYHDDGIRFCTFAEYAPSAEIDIAYCNGVFHHIPVAERDQAIQYVYRSLRPGGLFGLWENNPWNPGTRWVMSRCSFDRNAVTLAPPQTAKLARRNGFQVVKTDYLFFFPRTLRWFRSLEPGLAKLPLGGQYMTLCRKPLS
jgi:ubiquinone/menaquinone biosynthesis C-methylase UbiE